MNYQKNTQFTSFSEYIQIPSFSKPRLGPVYKASPVKWQPFSRLLTHARADLCVGKVSSWILSTLPGETWTLGHPSNACCLWWPCSIKTTSQSLSNLHPLDHKPLRGQVSALQVIHMDFSLKNFLAPSGTVLQGAYANLINGCALSTLFLTPRHGAPWNLLHWTMSNGTS